MVETKTRCELRLKNHQVDENETIRCTELDDQLQMAQMSRIELTPFHYLAPLERYDKEKPYLSRLPFLSNMKRTNIMAQEYPVTVYNLFGHEKLFTLEKSGFEFKEMPFKVGSWSDQTVLDEYIPVFREWLKKRFDCATVIIYAFNVRCYTRCPTLRSPFTDHWLKFRGDGNDGKENGPWKSPFFRVHCGKDLKQKP